MRIILSLAGVFFTVTTLAQTLPLDPAIRKGELPNGFTYYIRKNTEPANRVQLYLVNKVGSILEDEDQRGLAHFMEHMSFNGTTHYPKNELINYLQKSGVRFGADLNAYTDFDETIYELPIPTDNPELLHNGLQIMRDWAANATLDTQEINSERGVVLEEKRWGKGAIERMNQKTFPVFLNNSRYANRLAIGNDTVLNNFTKPALLRFYNDWYRPDLQALIVVGDINVDSMEFQIKSLFSDLKNPANERPRTNYTIPLTGKNQFIAVTDKEFPSTYIQILIKQKVLPDRTKQEYCEWTRRNLYNQMLSVRLSELAQMPNSSFIQSNISIETLFYNAFDAFSAFIAVKPGKLEDSFMSVWKMVQQLKQFGFTESEFERAKVAYLNNMDYYVKEKDKRNSEELIQQYMGNFLTGAAVPGYVAEYELTKTFLATEKLENINALSAAFISDSNRDFVIMAPQKDSASLPSEFTVNSWFNKVQNIKLTPYVDQFTNEPLIAEKLKPGKISSESRIKELGVTEIVLNNGVKVLLKPTDFKANEINIEAFSPGGSSLYKDSDFESASNAGSTISSMGLSHFPPTGLEKLLSGKILSVYPYIGERFEVMTGFSASKDLETAFQLIHLYFTSPRKDSLLFNSNMQNQVAFVANRHDDPKNVFGDTVYTVLGNYNIRRTGPSAEKFNKIDLNRSLEIYKERFANAGDFTFVFVGNFNLDSMKLLLKKYLGSLPSNSKKEEARDLGIHIPTGKAEITVRKGKEQKATVELVISGDYKYSPESNIKLEALSEILQNRITERLREKEGETYTPRVWVEFDKYPSSRYSFTIKFDCGPENVENLTTAAKEEIESLKTKGVTELDITKFASEETRQYELKLRDNNFWMDWLVKQYKNHDDPLEVLQYPALIKEITPASVQAAANFYLNENNFIKFLLLPEGK